MDYRAECRECNYRGDYSEWQTKALLDKYLHQTQTRHVADVVIAPTPETVS